MTVGFEGLFGGKPAKRPAQSPKIPARNYRSRIASVRAFSTGFSR
ncbi:hypothetical protein PS914_06642 [Pseudomonas fluorescens]|uniref:Uncharacterized protein n=1 Tax=Pseudomonas fluorescens TaxID=294 RepID=A0A5E7DSJ8_PSEFL|nr:hypothetical protein PS833_04076 [Pseudomonas fluorescens]VVQ21541.1 hypothetical protein PS914_06642 [Pseudomonas fluorescens]